MNIIKYCLAVCILLMYTSNIGLSVAQDSQQKQKNKKNELAIANKLKVKIGTEGAYVPFSYYNVNGQLIGFDIDLGNKLCERMNYECEWQVYDWTNLFQALERNSVQVVISSRSLANSHTSKIEKTNGYYKPYYVLTYHRDTSPEGTGTIDLVSKTIGVLKDTIEADLIKTHYTASRIKEFTQLDYAFYALSRHEINLLALDYSVATPWLAGKGDGRCCVYRPFTELNDLNVATVPIYINKTSNLLQASFGGVLHSILEDGNVSEIAKKHGLNQNLIEKTKTSVSQ